MNERVTVARERESDRGPSSERSGADRDAGRGPADRAPRRAGDFERDGPECRESADPTYRVTRLDTREPSAAMTDEPRED